MTATADQTAELIAVTGIPAIVCSGCERPIWVGDPQRFIQCAECGRKMHVLNIQPAGETATAGGG